MRHRVMAYMRFDMRHTIISYLGIDMRHTLIVYMGIDMRHTVIIYMRFYYCPIFFYCVISIKPTMHLRLTYIEIK